MSGYISIVNTCSINYTDYITLFNKKLKIAFIIYLYNTFLRSIKKYDIGTSRKCPVLREFNLPCVIYHFK